MLQVRWAQRQLQLGEWTLPLFGQSQQAEADILQGSKQYLVKLLGSAGECNTFDDLRYHLYMNKRKTISELPPTSASMMGHLLRSHYCLYSSKLYHPQKFINLDPMNYGWERDNGLLTPAKFYNRLPVEYTVACVCKKRCNGRCKCRRLAAECSEFCACGNICTNNRQVTSFCCNCMNQSPAFLYHVTSRHYL